MAEDLLNCPFCGAPAELERSRDHHGEWFNLGCSRHWGAVEDPDVRCPAGRIWYTSEPEEESAAIAAWNRRTPIAEQDAEDLMKALEPFAEAVGRFRSSSPDDTLLDGTPYEKRHFLTLGDLRRALAAYNTRKEG